LGASDFVDALDLLRPVRDVNMVSIPDRTDLQVQLAMIDHCTNMQDRFAILDAKQGAALFGTDSIELQRAGLDTSNGFAAVYYPWLVVGAATGSATLSIPPSGHIAGIYARTDTTRGVHKAPAGNEALVSGALAVERTMSDTDQGILNLEGINVVRVFTSGGRPVVWGARTTSTDTNWQYVNIRRLFIYIEGSIEAGIRWAVFEPNNLALWQKLKRTINEFLTRVWRDGGLFGARAEEAFYVRIDEALNPFSEQQLGRLQIEIGLRPSYPAEFIIVRIGIWPGGSEISEG
jgi:phage tail sheath protein FI